MDFINKLQTITTKGLPIHIPKALLQEAAGSDANWPMRCMGILSHVASETDRLVGQAYQSILGIEDTTQAKQLFIAMSDGGFGLSSAEFQGEPAMMASWTACAMRVTARIGLACVDDLSVEITGLRSALSKLQAIKRVAGDDPNDMTSLETFATSQRALALSRVNKATHNLREPHCQGQRKRTSGHRIPPTPSATPPLFTPPLFN